jgi:spore maturation protein SpmB
MEKLQNITVTGIKKGWSGFIWMLKILVPVSFFTLLLQYSGWLKYLDFLLEPAMQLINLPSIAALPLIVGMLTGIYGGIAAMIVLPLTQGQMTLIAIFLLISHNLIQEGIIQAKSGINPVKATVFRLLGSFVMVGAVAFFFPMEIAAENAVVMNSAAVEPFALLLQQWGISTALLAVKILAIIVSLMVVLEFMKAFNIIDRLINVMNPVLKIMGLDQKVGMLWLATVIFGITYGAALIVEETRQGHYEKEDLERLHLSIGINHAMIEDPVLFLPLGIGAFWLCIPRGVAGVAGVAQYNLLLSKKHARYAPAEKTG